MRKLRHYHELLSHREHYIQLLRSGQIKTQAHSLIHLYINQLTKAIDEQWSEQLANASLNKPAEEIINGN